MGQENIKCQKTGAAADKNIRHIKHRKLIAPEIEGKKIYHFAPTDAVDHIPDSATDHQ